MMKKLLGVICAVSFFYFLSTLTQAEEFVRGLPLSKSIMSEQSISSSTTSSKPYRQLIGNLNAGSYVLVLMKSVKNSRGSDDEVCLSINDVMNDKNSDLKPRCIGSDEVSMIKIGTTSNYRLNVQVNTRSTINFNGVVVTVK